jgi:acetylornithine/N-succinyldiaminopimelate aminotransferase
MKSFNEIKNQDKSFVANTYARFDVAFAAGKNAHFTDESGKDYIDFGSGIGTNSLGVAYAEWEKAASSQAPTQAHCSNL